MKFYSITLELLKVKVSLAYLLNGENILENEARYKREREREMCEQWEYNRIAAQLNSNESCLPHVNHLQLLVSSSCSFFMLTEKCDIGTKNFQHD